MVLKRLEKRRLKGWVRRASVGIAGHDPGPAGRGEDVAVPRCDEAVAGGMKWPLSPAKRPKKRTAASPHVALDGLPALEGRGGPWALMEPSRVAVLAVFDDGRRTRRHSEGH